MNIYYDTYKYNTDKKSKKSDNKLSKNNNKLSKSNNNINNNNKSDNPLLNNGLLFEKTVYEALQEKFPNHFEIISNNNNIDFDLDYKKTVDAINSNIPIIAQAVLVDNKTHLRGVADLLVRSDYLNKIFTRKVLDK